MFRYSRSEFVKIMKIDHDSHAYEYSCQSIAITYIDGYITI